MESRAGLFLPYTNEKEKKTQKVLMPLTYDTTTSVLQSHKT